MRKWALGFTAYLGALMGDLSGEALKDLVECELGRSPFFSALPKYRIVVAKGGIAETLESAADLAKGHAEEILSGYDYSIVFSQGVFCQADATFCTLFDGVRHYVGFTSKKEGYNRAIENLVDSIDKEMLWKFP